jgi:hypothetical protein
MYDEEDDADQEQEPGNLGGDGSNPEQPERSCHEANDEEHQRVVNHVQVLLL